MKRIFELLILNLFCLLVHTNIYGQVILDNNFKCIFSEIPSRGHGLTNGVITFFIDAKSRDLLTTEQEHEFLLNYRKTKDNLYYSTGKRGSLFYYEIVIPDSFFILQLTSTVNDTIFSKYSVALLNEVRKNRNSDYPIYFIRKNRKECTY